MIVSFERKSEFVERRRHGRAALNLQVSLRERGRSSLSARLLDLTPMGCRIDGLMAGARTTQLWIKLPGLENLPAHRIWHKGTLAGLYFDTPLHPVVAARFMPDPGSFAAAACAMPLGRIDPLLSRREQIMAGIAASDHSPLQRRKRPSGLGMIGRINRVVSRSVDHRAEQRYADAVPRGTTLAIHGAPVEVRNVSSSGIRVRGLLETSGIGDAIDLAFDGFPAMTGQLVWMNGSEAGIALPPASIELFDQPGA